MAGYDYTALHTELTSDPLGRGYATMTAAQASASLDAADIAVAVDVPVLAVFEALQEAGAWGAIALLARSAPASPPTAAQVAAISLVDMVQFNSAGTFAFSNPTVAGVIESQMNALEGAGLITAAQGAALLALGASTVSRASQIGWPGGVSDLDVAAALKVS